MKLKYHKIRTVKSPERTGLNAGFDFFVPSDFKNFILTPGTSINIPSGIKVKTPQGHALIGFNKSGIAAKLNLMVGACVVDENYTGEIHLNLMNVGKHSVQIKPDMKIVQFILIKVNYSDPVEILDAKDLYEPEDHRERGDGGFGSTGVY